VVPQVIYAVANGQGKGRGTRQGLDRVRYWRTVLLTTGEQAAVDHSRDGGTGARVVTLWGDPFGGPCHELPEVMAGLRENYGVAGPIWVEWLVRHVYGKLREDLRRELADFEGLYSDKLMREDLAGGVSARVARYLAAIEVVGNHATKVLELPWVEHDSVVFRCWDAIAGGAAVVDRPLEALRDVYSAACSAQHSFFGRHDPDRPPAQYAGRWDREESDWQVLALDPGFLRRVLTQTGHEPSSTLKAWRDRGWLRVAEGSRDLTLQVRIGGAKSRVYAIRRSVLDQHLGTKDEGKPA
jgi:hypothetical protein